MPNYKTVIQPMDIIMVYNRRSWLHRIIHGVTGYKAGHVALYLGDGMICEANKTGVHRKEWKDYNAPRRVFLARPIAMNETKELAIREFCFDSENQKYAYGQLILILIKNLLHVRHVPDVSKQAVICSEFVARAFRAGGIDLCPNLDPQETTPGDITNSAEVYVTEVVE